MPDNIPIRDANAALDTIRTRVDGAGVQTQLVGMDQGAQLDGHSLTLGTQADNAWTGAGSGSAIAILKALWSKLGGGVSVTQAAGSAVDGSSLTMGATGDAAWAGTGAGSLVALMKGVYNRLGALTLGTQYAENTAHVAPSNGMLLLAVRQDPGFTPLATATNAFSPLSTDDQGQLRVAPGQLIAQNAAVSRANASTVSAQILGANTARIGATFQNDSAAVCYLLEGTGAASATNYTAKLAANDPNSGIGGYYETPFGYTGAVQAAWATNAGGGIQATENS